MKKYESNLPTFAFGFLFYCLICAVVSCLPWGSYGWMTRMDFDHKSMDSCYAAATKHVLTEPLQLNCCVGTAELSPGDSVLILGQYRDLPDELSRSTRLVIHSLTYGIRGVGHIYGLEYPRMFLHDGARDDDYFFFHLIAYEEDLEKLVGQKLEQVESQYGPARYIYPGNDSLMIAPFFGYDLMTKDGKYQKGLVLKFASDGTLQSFAPIRQSRPFYWKWVAKIANFWMSHSATYFKPGIYTRSKYIPIISNVTTLLPWLLRGFSAFIDLLLLSLVGLFALWIVEHYMYPDKSVSNLDTELFVFFIVSFYSFFYILFTMEFGPALFGFIMLGCGIVFSSLSVEDIRCSKCHSMVEFEFVRNTDGRLVTTTYTNHHSSTSNYHRTSDSDYERNVHHIIDTTSYDLTHYVTKDIETRHEYDSCYRCPICGERSWRHHSDFISRNKHSHVTGKEHVVETKKYY